MRVVAIIQARMTSTRLPGKILLTLSGKPVLSHIIERVSRVVGLGHICVASPEGTLHDPIGDILPPGVSFVRGSETDVLGRYYKAAMETKADVMMRVTSDCPFFDAGIASGILQLFLNTHVDYASNHFDQGYPLGFEVEVFSREALERAQREATDPYQREHVTAYFWQNPDLFSALYVDHKPNLRHWRLVLDEPQDYEFAKEVYLRLYEENPLFGFEALKRLFKAHPGLLEINANVKQKPLKMLGQG